MTDSWLEIFGYVASLIILISILMNSIVRLRVINLIGATMFSIYGFMIGSVPVGFVNGAIALVNVYYLGKMIVEKEYFKILNVRGDSYYLKEFLSFYEKDIKKFFPDFVYEPMKNRYSFFILRNMNVAGIFMAREFTPGTLLITLDYAVPAYRDFKMGKYVFNIYSKKMVEDGYTRLVAYSHNRQHQRYLKKMGFAKKQLDNEHYFVKLLV